MKKNIFSSAVIALACAAFVILTACVTEPTEDQLFVTSAQADQIVADNGGVIMHLNDFKSKYMTQCGVYFPVRERSYSYAGGQYQIDEKDFTKNNLGWFSVDSIPTAGEQVYIKGRIVTEDGGGNWYKSMVIQEMVNGEQQALRISLDASNLHGQYLLGQEIMIHVNGLCIGKYANQPQLCVPSYNDNTNANKAEEKVGWCPGRIPAPLFAQHVTLIGKPNVSDIHYDDMLISEFIGITGNANNDQYFKYDGRLVRLSNVYFTGEYDNYGVPTACNLTQDPSTYTTSNYAPVFAPSTGGMGFPQGRIISDGSSKTVVSNSEYAKFAHYFLPGASKEANNCSSYKGTITGILGHYTDNGRNPADAWDWSITLRDFSTPAHHAIVEDIVFTDASGNPWTPVEWTK